MNRRLIIKIILFPFIAPIYILAKVLILIIDLILYIGKKIFKKDGGKIDS